MVLESKMVWLPNKESRDKIVQDNWPALEKQAFTLYANFEQYYGKDLLSNWPTVCEMLDWSILSNIKVFYCATYVFLFIELCPVIKIRQSLKPIREFRNHCKSI